MLRYPPSAKRRAEREGLIESRWELPPSGPARRVSALTDAGRHRLARQVTAWQRLVEAVSSVTAGAPHGQPA